MSARHGALVVGGARAVRRPDLDQARAGAREHVGDAEAVADLDQLAARDEHLASLGQRGEREQHRAGVVVDDDRRLGAGQPAQQRGDVILPRPARPFGEVVLEVRIGHGRPRPRARSRRRAAGRGRGSCGRSRRSRSARDAGPAAARPRARRRAAAARSPGSTPARISSRARARTRPRRLDGQWIVAARASARRRKAGRAAPRSARLREWETLQMGRLTTRRSRCFTVRVKRAALVLLRRGRAGRARRRRRACARVPRGGQAGGARARDRRRRRSRGPRSTPSLARWAKLPVTIRAGGHSYHVPRGWLVSRRP